MGTGTTGITNGARTMAVGRLRAVTRLAAALGFAAALLLAQATLAPDQASAAKSIDEELAELCQMAPDGC